jgi:hypothetical protein
MNLGAVTIRSNWLKESSVQGHVCHLGRVYATDHLNTSHFQHLCSQLHGDFWITRYDHIL